VLLELAAANAAFAVIKEAVQNSGDLMAAGSKVFEYFDAKSAIQKRYESKARDSRSNDIEEFFALEQLKKQQMEEVLTANPLMNQEMQGTYSLKKRWYEETVFKN
jgi:hypothetical protein